MLTNDAEISLFPLNVVLFPGMMLPLHIFEERYKAMIKECMGTDAQTFGVILAKSKQAQAPNVAELYASDLYHIGTTARITAVEHLKDGKMNLITVGQERFIVKDVKPSQDDFLVGYVDPLPLPDDVNFDNDEQVEKLRLMVKEYINHLASLSGEDLSSTTLPTDPKALAYLAGTAMQSSLPDKQQVLAAKSLNALISTTVTILDKENKILAYMLKAYQAHQQVQRLPFVDYSLN